mgnify:CR=1 FL=1
MLAGRQVVDQRRQSALRRGTGRDDPAGAACGLRGGRRHPLRRACSTARISATAPSPRATDSRPMDTAPVRRYFADLQSRIVARLEAIDGRAFRSDAWDRPEGGGGLSRIIEEGSVLERGGVNFSHVKGDRLPPSATATRPQLAGRAFEGARRVAGTASTESLRADGAHERADVRGARGGSRGPSGGSGRHGPHALLRVRRGRDPLPPHLPRRARAVRRRLSSAVQAMVRRVFLYPAPQRAARRRRHLLRRSERGAASSTASR